MNALVPLSLVFCRCGRASRELLIFADVGVVIGVAVGGFAVVGSESTCREESTCCCCIDARLVSGVEIGVVSDGRGEVVSGVEVGVVWDVGIEVVWDVEVEAVSGVEVGVVSDRGVGVVSGRELEVDVEIVVSEEASFFFEDCDFAECEFFA